MGGWKRKHRQAFGNVGLHPRSQSGSFLLMFLDRQRQQALRLLAVGRTENGPDIRRHFRFHLLAGDVRLGVLLQVELTSLPPDAAKYGFAGLFQTGVIVTDDELHSVQPTLRQAL